MVQNQTGRFPKRWDRSGTIVETRDNEQYVVKMAGSGRLTLRNRRFLRKCTLASTPSTVQPSSPHHLAPPVGSPVSESHQQKIPSIETARQALPSTPKQVLLPSGSVARSADNDEKFPSPQSNLCFPSTPRAPNHAIHPQSRLNYDEHEEQASSPPDISGSPVAPPRVSGRARSQRKVYDASTGQYQEPSSVPDDV